jgi:Leucine rich repeat variant
VAGRKPQVLQLPRALADEIADVARRAQRSVAFVVHRTLLAGKEASPVTGPTAPLPLTTDEDDPPSLSAKLHLAAAGRALEEALVGSWPLAREKFHAWLQRLEEASQAERADDLDRALSEAASSATPPARLTELAKSEYPKVRALVAVHPSAPPEAVEKLRADRERSVREAAQSRT